MRAPVGKHVGVPEVPHGTSGTNNPYGIRFWKCLSTDGGDGGRRWPEFPAGQLNDQLVKRWISASRLILWLLFNEPTNYGELIHYACEYNYDCNRYKASDAHNGAPLQSARSAWEKPQPILRKVIVT